MKKEKLHTEGTKGVGRIGRTRFPPFARVVPERGGKTKAALNQERVFSAVHVSTQVRDIRTYGI